MHTTKTRDIIKGLKSEASAMKRQARMASKVATILPDAPSKALELEEGAADNLAQAESLQDRARLEDLHLWVMVKTFDSKRRGITKHEYWMASWRMGSKVHNEYLGSCKKRSAAQALSTARKIKAEALGIKYAGCD